VPASRRRGCSAAMRLGVVGGGDLRSASRALVFRICRLLAEGCEGGRGGWRLLGMLRLGTLRLGTLRWEVRSAAADLRSEGNGDMSGWWRWWMGDAGGGEEG
jgi:hypothetical protein